MTVSVLKRIFILLVLSAIAVINGCSNSGDSGFGGVAPTCTSTVSCAAGGSIESCVASDNSACWYQVGGQIYNCDLGCDCVSAASDATAFCQLSQNSSDNLAVDLVLEKTKNIKLTQELDAAYKLILE